MKVRKSEAIGFPTKNGSILGLTYLSLYREVEFTKSTPNRRDKASTMMVYLYFKKKKRIRK